MDADRLDDLARSAAATAIRRRFLAGAAALLFAIAGDARAKKKKKKKKTLCHDGRTIKVAKKAVRAHLAHGDTPGPCPSGGSCQELRAPCSNDCCGALVCEDVADCAPPDAPSGDYCCGPEGEGCAESCDCCGLLQCSERQGNTCRACGFEQDACSGTNDCCLLESTCGQTACATEVCCLQLGAACAENCDCCGSAGDCAQNNCFEDKEVCCRGEGAACAEQCDCCGVLGCSERQADTCQDCRFPQESCAADDDCCLALSTCGDNGCEQDPLQVCCQNEGGFCFQDCDCCAAFTCDLDQNACVPEAVPRQRGDTTGRSRHNTTGRPSGKERWPSRN